MKIFMSLWTKPNPIFFIDLWKLSLYLAKKHFRDIELITDTNGYNLTKNLPFNNFHVILDNIPDYPSVWSLGKIYSYKYAAQYQSFLHLDHDVLLWESLPYHLLNSDIFCQSEDPIESTRYSIDMIQNMYRSEIPKIWIQNKELASYNMGIFGGQNYELINKYCDFVLDMINDTKYKNLWQSDKYQPLDTHKSIMIEQGNLAIFLQHQNIKPSMLFDNTNKKIATYKKYTHLVNDKYKPEIVQKIIDRVATEPYNLLPCDINIEDW